HAPPEISSLSLHDALPILRAGAPVPRRQPSRDRHTPPRAPHQDWHPIARGAAVPPAAAAFTMRTKRRRIEQIFKYPLQQNGAGLDRKSTRLNSSHVKISYA